MKVENRQTDQARRILLAATKCISTKGYANTSLREIADEAGVVLSQLNYYYTNKEGLLIGVISMMKQAYMAELDERLAKGQTPEEKLELLVTYFRELLDQNPHMFRMLFDLTAMALWSDKFRVLLKDIFTDIGALIENRIMCDISQKKPEFARYSPNSLSRVILGAAFGTAAQVILDPSERELTDAFGLIPQVLT